MEEEARTQSEEAAVPEEPVVAERAAQLQPTLKALYDMRKRMQVAPQIIYQKCSAGFHAGEKAKRMGWTRTPVNYNDGPLADDFFYAGFDGESWRETVYRLIGKPQSADAQSTEAQPA